MPNVRAHKGIETTTYGLQEREFEMFCKRQSSRAAAAALKVYRRYLDRVLRERDARSAELECQTRGFGRGGGASNYGKSREDY